MSKLKVILLQSVLVSTAIVIVYAIYGIVDHIKGYPFTFYWYYPLSILAAGVVCSIPTLILIVKDFGKKISKLRILVHCLVMYVIVLGMGRLFNWYSNLKEMLYITISFIGVYILVWISSYITMISDDKKINEALSKIRDDE